MLSVYKQRGATVVEYVLMVAFIAMAVIVTVMLVGQELDDRYQSVVECVQAQTPEEVAAACD